MAMENTSKPRPPNLSEGCFNCGHGKDQILVSKLVNSANVALCRDCQLLSKMDSRPFNARPYIHSNVN